MRGEGTKLGEGERKVRLSQDRITILSFHHLGLLHTFGICVYVRDFYDFRECYVRDCYVWENYVAPFCSCPSTIFDQDISFFSGITH